MTKDPLATEKYRKATILSYNRPQIIHVGHFHRHVFNGNVNPNAEH